MDSTGIPGGIVYGDKRYIVSPYSFRWPQLDFSEVGRAVVAFISTCREVTGLEALLTHLQVIYEVDRVTLERDVRAFLDDCIEKDYLINADLDVESDAVIREIHALQSEVPGLCVTNFGFEVRLGKAFTPGCQSCSRGTWAVFNVGLDCNLSCSFCPYTNTFFKQQWDARDPAPGAINISFLGTRFRSERDLKLQFDIIRDEYDGIAWVGGEPMMPAYRESLTSLIRYFHQAYPSYHQWLYTNGTFTTIQAMQEFRDAGIRELRFNLAATNFSRQSIAAMKDARKIFDFVCLEVPMTRPAYEGLMANIDEILDTGLDQMNLAEFIIGRHHLEDPAALADEGRLYVYKGFICSPVESRRRTYEVIKRAAAEQWPVVINDCSNEYKYYKLSKGHRGSGVFNGRMDYWNNNYSLRDIDRLNDRFELPGAGGSGKEHEDCREPND